MEGNIKEHLVKIVTDIFEEGEIDLFKENVIFEWTYPETQDVTYTLLIGPQVLDDSGEFSNGPSIN